MDAAEHQTITFANAVLTLEDYTSKCTADFADVEHAHMQVRRADTAASTQLQETWHAVEHEMGLLAARIADSHGFVQLARLDAASADFETNRTAICGQGEISREASLLAVDQSVSQGFVEQTWKQLMVAFDEMDMLRGRFFALNLKTPSNQTLIQAADRAATAFMEVVEQRSNIAFEAAQRACGQDASLLAAAAAESKRFAAKLVV